MRTGLDAYDGTAGPGGGATAAADFLAEKEATPTIKERLTKDTVTTTLMSIEGEY